jgi:hypothetical protein
MQVVWHVLQAWPPMPHAVSVFPSWQTPAPSQHPMMQVIVLQGSARPPPAPEPPPLPLFMQTPLMHCSGAEHARQDPPPSPHRAAVGL